MTDEPKEEECPTSPTPDTLHECVQEYLDQKEILMKATILITMAAHLGAQAMNHRF